VTIPLPIISGVFRVAFNWTSAIYTQRPVNVMHFLQSGTGATPAQLLTALESTVTTGMWYTVNSAMTVSSLSIIPLDGTSPTTVLATSGGSKWSGQGVGQPVPQVAAVITFRTALRGRANRGRCYLPMSDETYINNGVIAPTQVTGLALAWETFRLAIPVATPHGFNLGVASYDRAHSGAGAHFNSLLSTSVNSLTATQRRRQPGRKVARHRALP
jgi:hypothetical protein